MVSNNKTNRRSFLRAAGGAAAAVAVAGCLDNDSGGNNNATGGGKKSDSSGGSTGSDVGGNGSNNNEIGGTLIYGRGDHPTLYDPQQSSSNEVGKVTNQIFSHLIGFVPGSGGKLKAGLAKKYNLNGKSVTLKLRKDVKFHNGEEFTAADFKATYRRFIDPDYKYYLGKNSVSGAPVGVAGNVFGNWIESININGKYDLDIKLKQKYAPFLRNLGEFFSVVLSKKQIEEVGEDQNKLGTNPIGTGPFSFKKLDNNNQRVLLEKYNGYWGEGPYVDQLIFKTIKENSTRAQALINGDAHIIDGLGAQASKQIENSDSTSLLQKQGINIGYMAMNMSRYKPFRKKKVRQAISYAVNTKAIVSDIYEGFATQASQLIPSNVLGYNDSLNPYPNDKKKAEKLLKQAGETDLNFELATFSNPRGYNPSPIQTAQQVKSDLADIGLNTKINQFSTFSSYIQYISSGKHDACFIGIYTDNADPDNFYATILDPGVDKSKIPKGQDWVSPDIEGFNTFDQSAWANRKFMDLTHKGQINYKQSKRKSIYKQAGKLAYEEAPCVFIDHAKTLRGVNDTVDKSTYRVSSIDRPQLELVKLKQ